MYESQNKVLEQEKSDLAETVNMLRAGQIKTEPGRKLKLSICKRFPGGLG